VPKRFLVPKENFSEFGKMSSPAPPNRQIAALATQRSPIEASLLPGYPAYSLMVKELVDLIGIEPMTSSMPFGQADGTY